MKKITFIGVVCLMTIFFISTGVSGSNTTFNVHQLTDKITSIEKQKITLTGIIAGACMSGCKIWLTDDQYKKGDPVILVWAKDSAFKFKTGITGQKINLQGFAIGKYIDLCSSQNEQEEAKQEETCEKPKTLQSDNDKKLDSITFFATEVNYL